MSVSNEGDGDGATLAGQVGVDSPNNMKETVTKLYLSVFLSVSLSLSLSFSLFLVRVMEMEQPSRVRSGSIPQTI